MTRSFRAPSGALLCLLLAACTAPQHEADADAATPEAAAGQPTVSGTAARELACVPQRQDMDRTASPYDSTIVPIGEARAKICYSRPSARGRMVFDSLVPYGRLWRTGANEPTILHSPIALRVAGIDVPAGSYSLYTIPERGAEWQVIVNRSLSQWGHESRYSAEVEAQEVGRAAVPATTLNEPVEQFTIRAEAVGPDAANVILEWVTTRVTIPVTAR